VAATRRRLEAVTRRRRVAATRTVTEPEARPRDLLPPARVGAADRQEPWNRRPRPAARSAKVAKRRPRRQALPNLGAHRSVRRDRAHAAVYVSMCRRMPAIVVSVAFSALRVRRVSAAHVNRRPIRHRPVVRLVRPIAAGFASTWQTTRRTAAPAGRRARPAWTASTVFAGDRVLRGRPTAATAPI
jgi:hypothetical protein